MFKGVLNKMKTEIDSSLNYFLELDDDFININQLLGLKIKLSFNGYECLNCKCILGRDINASKNIYIQQISLIISSIIELLK